MTLKIFDQIETWAIGPALITSIAERQLAPGADRKTVVNMLVASLTEQIRFELESYVVSELTQVMDIYELSEGEAPEDQTEALVWGAGMEAALIEALQGDVTELLGADAVQGWIADPDGTLDEIAEAITSALSLKPKFLGWAGIKVEDIEALAQKMGAASNSNPGGSHVNILQSANIDEQILGGTVRDAPPPPRVMTSAEAEDFHSGKRHRSPTVRESDTTIAAQNLLEVLIAKTRLTDQDVATAVGVSRPQAYNYRTGKTKWAPTAEQLSALAPLIFGVTNALEGAWLALKPSELK